MRRNPALIALSLALTLLLTIGCGRRARVIPQDKMSDIYAEMLLADQWISSNLKARRVADTTLFYAPILEKYGFNLADYEKSVRHYMKKPELFSEILTESSKKLTAYSKKLQAVEDEIKSRPKLPPFKKIDFNSDTLLWAPDTSAVLADSLSGLDIADSLSFTVDSTVNKTITDTTNYERKRDTEEMLLLHGPDDSASRRHPIQRERVGRKSNTLAR